MGWDGEIGPGTSFYTFLAIKNQLTINEIMKKTYILTTTKLGFLSRVLFNGGCRTCLLIGRDQTKVVLPNICWNVSVDYSGLLINMNLTLGILPAKNGDFMGIHGI